MCHFVESLKCETIGKEKKKSCLYALYIFFLMYPTLEVLLLKKKSSCHDK